MGFCTYALLNLLPEFGFNHFFAPLRSHAMNPGFADALQAPLWSIPVVNGYEAVFGLLESLWTVAVFWWLARRMCASDALPKFHVKEGFKWILPGGLAALAGIAMCLWVDSLRLELPLAEPNIRFRILIAIPVCFCAILAGMVFALKFLYSSAKKRLGSLWALTLVATLEFAAMAGWHLSIWGMTNLFLLMCICCLLYDRHGLVAPVGLIFGWKYVLSAIFTLSKDGVWTVYHVSDLWLTGGNLGLDNSAWMTLLLIGLLVYMFASRKGHSVSRT